MSFLQNQVSIEMGAGTVIAFPGTTAPGGWLLCNGDPYSRTTYSALFGVIGTDYGVGNGTTTFNVPNFQAAFLRGAGTQTYPTTGGTPYAASTINTAQGTALQTHNHAINSNIHSHSVGSVTDTHEHGANVQHTHYLTRYSIAQATQSYKTIKRSAQSNNSYSKAYFAKDGGGFGTNSVSTGAKVKSNATGITINSSSTVNTNNSTTNPNSYETIPFNYSINWIIKY
jgi:microcystin-dependent protein